MLSTFSCPLNRDVEHFIQKNAIESTKKDQTVTYLVFNKESADLVGYFSIAIKPISIKASIISKSAAKKFARISILEDDVYTASAYLIAQLGKNFAVQEKDRISGTELLNKALEIIEQSKYTVGGVVEFLECEDKEILKNFYATNGFKIFGSRFSKPSNENEAHLLHQLFRFI